MNAHSQVLPKWVDTVAYIGGIGFVLLVLVSVTYIALIVIFDRDKDASTPEPESFKALQSTEEADNTIFETVREGRRDFS